MGFFDKVKNAAGNAVNTISDAGKEVTEKARINKSIKNEETRLNNLFYAIGQKYFNENQTAPAGYEDLFSGIKSANTEIEKLKQELALIGSNANCPKCGAKFVEGQQFCRGCGTNLVELQEQMRKQQEMMMQQQMAQQQAMQQQMAQQQAMQQPVNPQPIAPQQPAAPAPQAAPQAAPQQPVNPQVDSTQNQ